MPTMMFIGNLNYVAIAVVGGLRVASGSMSLGDVQAFIQYSRQFTQPLTQVASMANVLQSGVASAERVFELLDADEQSPDPTRPRARTRPRGRVAFEHVSFRYSPDTPLIEDLSLVAEPGQTVAIVGPTGAGKTTLVNLIMRFYELDGGRITLDGVDIAAMRRADLRGRIGMVLQDTWLFGGTIRENIAYGDPAPPRSEIVAAARASYVDRFVRSLPDGYDTVIDDDGSNLSAGEKQLITIARAFLADPAILILDEATSSVDTRTEVLVQRAMAALRGEPDQLRDRAPAVHHPRRRPDPGDGTRGDRRAGQPPGAAAARRGVRRAAGGPVRRAAGGLAPPRVTFSRVSGDQNLENVTLGVGERASWRAYLSTSPTTKNVEPRIATMSEIRQPGSSRLSTCTLLNDAERSFSRHGTLSPRETR